MCLDVGDLARAQTVLAKVPGDSADIAAQVAHRGFRVSLHASDLLTARTLLELLFLKKHASSRSTRASSSAFASSQLLSMIDDAGA